MKIQIILLLLCITLTFGMTIKGNTSPDEGDVEQGPNETGGDKIDLAEDEEDEEPNLESAEEPEEEGGASQFAQAPSGAPPTADSNPSGRQPAGVEPSGQPPAGPQATKIPPTAAATPSSQNNSTNQPASTYPISNQNVKGNTSYTPVIAEVQQQGTGCFATFVNSIQSAGDVKTRNTAYAALQSCLKGKCPNAAMKKPNKKFRRCAKKARGANGLYQCRYTWFNEISEACDPSL